MLWATPLTSMSLPMGQVWAVFLFAPVSYTHVFLSVEHVPLAMTSNSVSMGPRAVSPFHTAYMVLSMLMVAACIYIRCPSGMADPSHTLPQEELENFPLSTVQHSQTVLNQLRYPSVLLLVCQDLDQNKPDIHFFHCDEVEVRQTTRGGHDAS